ncbi:hypothetical protein HHK36_004943 [Tetracentron sinense]|uniref:Uncharacterized protein n=1 Tax=Tetracentron sinense TaxID=13715 RepID=A0A835DQB0_TETSI|nr:hypothetical protein HHK36_004943 [Tetracentron sinense]
MPRSRGSEMPQKKSQRAPLQLRTSSSESDPLHHRPVVDRSPKLGDRRSPRGAQSDHPLNQKKLGTRIADLESQLGQAQEELKNLKEQLDSAEAAKKEAQEELGKKTQKPIIPDPEEEEKNSPTEIHKSNEEISSTPDESPEENQPETDVFEVPVPPMVEPTYQTTEQEENETNPIEKSTEPPPLPEPEKKLLDELSLKNAEIDLLKTKLEEEEKKLEVFYEENESLKNQITNAAVEAASARVKQEETAMKLSELGNELEASKANVTQLNQKLEGVEGAKAELETEMKKLRVQTEQWRKAADAAAAVLAGGVEMNGRRVAGRCGSMDKHLSSGSFEQGGGYSGLVGSPMMGDDIDDGFGSGKRKGAGIRMFGDLWKKKAQK